MRFGLFIALSATLIVTRTAAADGFGPPQGIADAFNSMAKAAKVVPRMVLRECSGEPPNRCMFGIGGNVAVAAFADEKAPGSTSLIVFAADRSSDPARYTASAANALATWSGSDDLYEIKAAFEVLFKKPIKEEDVRTVTMKGATFILKPIGGGGIFFTVRDRALD